MSTRVTETLTVSRDHFLSHMAGAEACGVKLEPLYRKRGVTAELLENPGVRIPYRSLIDLRLDICKQLDDESEGFAERRAPWGSTVLICRAIVASRTLREAILRYRQFNAIMNDEVSVDLSGDKDEVSIDFTFENRKRLLG